MTQIHVESIAFSQPDHYDDWDKLLASEQAVEVNREVVLKRSNTIFLGFILEVPDKNRNRLVNKIHRFTSMNAGERKTFMNIKDKDRLTRSDRKYFRELEERKKTSDMILKGEL